MLAHTALQRAKAREGDGWVYQTSKRHKHVQVKKGSDHLQLLLQPGLRTFLPLQQKQELRSVWTKLWNHPFIGKCCTFVSDYFYKWQFIQPSGCLHLSSFLACPLVCPEKDQSSESASPATFYIRFSTHTIKAFMNFNTPAIYLQQRQFWRRQDHTSPQSKAQGSK